jgi:hypothetical protein
MKSSQYEKYLKDEIKKYQVILSIKIKILTKAMAIL